jgi:hypothetical protein
MSVALEEEIVELKQEIRKLTSLLEFMISSTIRVYEEELAHGSGLPVMQSTEGYQGIN